MSVNAQESFDEELQTRLQDPAKRMELWQQFNSASAHNPFTSCGMFPGAAAQHLTPSGTAQGAGSSSSGSSPPFFPPMWWPPYPPFFTPTHAVSGSHLTPFFPRNPSPVQETENGDNPAIQDSDDDDSVLLHDNKSNTLFAEFNPEIKESGTWDPPEQMNAFLEWHFNCGLSPAERDAILGDFPKPNCPALEVPRLDDEVRSQLKSRGKDPQFGQ